MKDIYLLIEHGIDQGEVYVLGYFDDERRAKEVAEEKEWEAYRASLKAEHVWSSHKPLAPDKTAYRRFWIKAVSRFERVPVPRSSAALKLDKCRISGKKNPRQLMDAWDSKCINRGGERGAILLNISACNKIFLFTIQLLKPLTP